MLSAIYIFFMIYFFLVVTLQISLSSQTLMTEKKQNITIASTATGQPQPSNTWSKSVGSLPKGRNKVINGALTIYNVTKNDRGIYICKAENILGSVPDTVLVMVFCPLRFKVLPPRVVTPLTGYTLRFPCVAESDLRLSKKKNGMSSLPETSNVHRNGTLVLANVKKSHQGSYTCRASNALTTIEAKVQVNGPVTAASCSVIRKHVSSVSGNYVIDPDGKRGLAPFNVYFDMADKNGVGVTVISHDSEGEGRTRVREGLGWGGRSSYSCDIHHNGASFSQLASLTRVSLHCERFIKYECYDSRLMRSGMEWWVSRDSTKMTYWDGASPGSGKCSCGMTNSCANPSYGCNCDKNDGVWRENSGLLTDMTKLPVKQLRFGDAGSSYAIGYHTLRKLKCYGTTSLITIK